MKNNNWKVELRTNCKVCNSPIMFGRFRTYCSTKCRNKSNYQKNKAYLASWQKERNDKKHSIKLPGTIQCAVCGKWYVQICSHVIQKHHMSSRQYKKVLGRDVKKGLIPEWYREIKSDQAYEHETFKNNLIKGGAMTRFEPGDSRAGKYIRSPETMERLRFLHKFNNKNK